MVRVLGLIPARGGSKGLPNKNILPVGGIPLIVWTIRVAQRCHWIDRLIVSTDDDRIADAARHEGCDVPFRRPATLSTDTATSADVVVHALESLNESFDAVALLQPTSPLRQLDDLNTAFRLFEADPRPSSVVSLVELPCPPSSHYALTAEGQLQRLHPQLPLITRRQDAQPVVTPNGAIYLVDAVSFLQSRHFVGPSTRGFCMPRGRSLDIDEPCDFEYLQFLCHQHPSLVPQPVSKSCS